MRKGKSKNHFVKSIVVSLTTQLTYRVSSTFIFGSFSNYTVHDMVMNLVAKNPNFISALLVS